MENLKEKLMNGGLVFIEKGECDAIPVLPTKFSLRLDENKDVWFEDLESKDGEDRLGRKQVLRFIKRGIKKGFLELDKEDESIIYFNMDCDEVAAFFLEY